MTLKHVAENYNVNKEDILKLSVLPLYKISFRNWLRNVHIIVVSLQPFL